MAVEIHEMIIRAAIGPKGGEGGGAAEGGGGKAEGKQQQIVEACVEQVLDIMRRKRER